MENMDCLKNTYLFKDLDEDSMEWLSEVVSRETYIGGDQIFDQGDKADKLYIVKTGSISISRWSETEEEEIATINAGTPFGEMAFLEKETRSAIAKASEPVELLVIPFDKLEERIKANNDFGLYFYRAIAHYLNQRIRKTSDDLSSLKELKLKHH